MEQQETFKEYGYNFQIKTISNLITDRTFLSKSTELIKPEFFDGQQLQWICKTIYNYFGEFKELPTLEVFKSEIVKKLQNQELLKTEVVTALRDIWKSQHDSDSTYIQGEALEFSKNQSLKAAILKSVDLLKSGRYDAIKDEIENSLKLGLDYNLGFDVLENIEAAHDKEALNHITTGWPAIDDLTGGGLPKKKLGIIIGALGSGKSFIATHLGASAAEAGYIVMHYTLELTDVEVAERYQARMAGIAIDNLVVHMSSVKSRLKNVTGRIFVKEFLEGVSIDGIASHLDQCKILGIIPDLVIIDYDELINLPNLPTAATSSDISRAMQLLYRDARRKIAVAHDCALWMPAQSTKEGAEEDVIRTTHSAGSYGKNRESDFVLTLSRKDKDKVSNTARISIQKSRLGPDGIVLPAEFDTSKAKIVIHREETTDGKKTRKKMQTDDEFAKDYLKNKLDDFLGTETLNKNRIEPGELF